MIYSGDAHGHDEFRVVEMPGPEINSVSTEVISLNESEDFASDSSDDRSNGLKVKNYSFIHSL